MTTTDTNITEKAETPTHLMELFAQRAGAGDVDGLLELYEPGAIFVPDYGVEVRGNDALRGALTEFLTIQPKIRYTAESDVVVMGDLALVTNFWSMDATAPDGSPIREEGVSADVCVQRADGSWAVLIDQPRGTTA